MTFGRGAAALNKGPVMSTVIPFRSSPVVRTDTDDSVSGEVICVWGPAPSDKAKPSWMRHRAYGLQAPMSSPTPAPIPEGAQSNTNRIMRVAVPKTGPLDISERFEKLPNLEWLALALESIVPAECLSFAPLFWISETRDHGSKEKPSRLSESRIQEASGGIAPTARHPEDAETFAAMRCLNRHQLKELHPEIFDMTYKSWDDTKQRCQKEGASLHPRLSAFSDFLAEVGPRIRREYTLDRVRPGELGGRYEPGNLRWMDKRGQANNRGSTRMLTYKGIEKPASIWAEEFNQKRNTVLSRIDRQGWSVEEALTGQRRGRTSFEKRPWDHNADVLEREKAEQFYLKNKHTSETPLEFCSRKYAEGLWPWKSLLDGLGFYQGEDVDPTDSIATHCLPTLLKAKTL